MDVAAQIAIEGAELRHAHGVSRAAVRGRRVIARQRTDCLHLVAGVAMLALHHPDRVLDASERAHQAAAQLVGVRGQIAHVGEQHALLFEHVLREVLGHPPERRQHEPQLCMAGAVDLLELREQFRDPRQRGPHVDMVRLLDVIDQLIDRPARGIVGALVDRRQRLQLPDHRIGISGRGAAAVDQRPPPAAAEVDAELLEHGRRPEIGRHDVADRRVRRHVTHDLLRRSLSVAGRPARRYDPRHMLDDALRKTTIFRRLSPDDRQRLAAVAAVREFGKGEMLFAEGDGSDYLYTIVSGRVKVFKTTPRGTDVILEIFGPGDPVGAVAAYESRAYPATAVALEPTRCLLIPRQEFFRLLELYPSLVRGLLIGLTHRLVELTNRLAELSGGRVEARLARFFLKMAADMGQQRPEGTFVPLLLSRQEIADMIGTTVETSIRIMSRWGKQDLVRTEKDGFLVVDRRALEEIALT